MAVRRPSHFMNIPRRAAPAPTINAGRRCSSTRYRTKTSQAEKSPSICSISSRGGYHFGNRGPQLCASTPARNRIWRQLRSEFFLHDVEVWIWTGPAGMPHCNCDSDCNGDSSASGLDLGRADHVELSSYWCRRKSDHQIFHHPQSQQDQPADRTNRRSGGALLRDVEWPVHGETARIAEGGGQLRAH